MIRRILGGLTIVAALQLGALTADGEATMCETLKPPAIVQLDFLKYIKEDPSWLAGELRSKGYRDGWKIVGQTLTTADLDVLTYVQRIKGFCFLDRSRTLPYFELRLKDASGLSATCVTIYPRDVVPELGANDFRKDTFSVKTLDTEEIASCRVPENVDATPFAGMSREQFRQKFFGKFGELLMAKFKSFNGDPGFIHHARALGYYPFRAQFTGYLQITLDE